MLRWEEPRNRYDQLFWQAEHFACIGQGLQDSPLRPLSRVLQNLQVMDEVRRRWARCLTKNAKSRPGIGLQIARAYLPLPGKRTRTMPDVCCPALRLHGRDIYATV